MHALKGDFGEERSAGAAPHVGYAAEIDVSDADLRRVIERWNDLPGAIRAGVLALVESTCKP